MTIGFMALRYWITVIIALSVVTALSPGIYAQLAAHDPHMTGALLGGMVAAAATALGTIPAILTGRISRRMNDSLMGFGAGVMLAATSFSLIIPALDVASDQGIGPWLAGGIVGVGIVTGALGLLLIERVVPHEHFIKGVEGGASVAVDIEQATRLKRVWLFVIAITLHNLPEGLAIGVAFAGPDLVGARTLAAGIAIQDIPEGLVVALALMSVGFSRRLSLCVGALSGLVEPVAAVLGVALIGLSVHLLPWGLAIAAGAMLFVISHEIIPESHRAGHEIWATGGLVIGFVLMMFLDTALA
ncbi:MAG: ZIP family metal transporter [Halioglobus sp.]|nr:ZIP family metal transporter [Halioglobus sp.]